jgi:hypothetical protein
MAECVKAVQAFANNLVGQGENAGTDIEAKRPGTVTAGELEAARESQKVLGNQYADAFAALRSDCPSGIAGFMLDQGADLFNDYGLQKAMYKFEKRAGRAGTPIPEQTEAFMSALRALPQDDATGIVKLEELMDRASIRSSGAR